MANDQRPRVPTANALFDVLDIVANELNEIRGICENAYTRSRDPNLSATELWMSGEFPFALGAVMARTWEILDRLNAFGVVPDLDAEQRERRGRELVQTFRRDLQKELSGVDAEKLSKALAFCRNLADEELAHVPIGTGAEVALRHIARKAREAIGDE